MSWLRWWTGTVNDPKWRIVASRAKCRPGDCVAVWAYLLEIAKDGDGDISNADAEECAVVLGYEIEAVTQVIAAMRDKSLIEGPRIASWDKRQPKREDDSKARVAAYRARQAEEKSVTVQGAQPCNAPVTQRNAPETESETEKDTSSLRSDVERASAPPRKADKRACRLPDDFAPGESGKESALKAGMTISVMMDELRRFTDYHKAKGSRMVDWQAAWRTWCGNYRPRAGPAQRPERLNYFAQEALRLENERTGRTEGWGSRDIEGAYIEVEPGDRYGNP